MFKVLRYLMLLLFVVMFIGCGGDGENAIIDSGTDTDTTAPVFTSDDHATVAENQTSAITLVATDATAVSYIISEGDATDFDVNSSTGVVTFKVAPDFEDRDTYTFTATATDSCGNEATQDVTINISDEDEGIVHNGTAYGVVTSPYTGKEWLDRNLGATMVCSESRDSGSFADDASYVASQKDCFGDYYQWGRNYDGHQESNSTVSSVLAIDINLTTQQNIVDNNGSFITSPDSPYDWLDVNSNDVDDSGSIRSANWSKTDGSSVCPVGFRVPTIDELKAELLDSGSAEIEDRDDAYESFLKLPSSGYRRHSSASMYYIGSDGSVWSSSAGGSYSSGLYFNSHDADWGGYGYRADAHSVRCLRD